MKTLISIALLITLLSCNQKRSKESIIEQALADPEFQKANLESTLKMFDEILTFDFPNNTAEFVITFNGTPDIKKQTTALPNGSDLEILRAELTKESDTSVYVAEYILAKRDWLDIYFKDETFLRKMVEETGNQYGYQNYIYEIDNSRKSERIIKIVGNYNKKIPVSETENIYMRFEINYYFGDSTILQTGYGVPSNNFPYGQGVKFMNSVKIN